MLTPNKRRALILSLVEVMKKAGSWVGETHIQKSVFFLQDLLGVPLNYAFVIYKHGPYSFELHDDLTEARASLLLELTPQRPYGPSFSLAELAKQHMERFPTTAKIYEAEIEFVARNISTRDVHSLERIATAQYVINEFPNMSAQDRASVISTLKPHIDISEALEALREVENLVQGAMKTTCRDELNGYGYSA